MQNGQRGRSGQINLLTVERDAVLGYVVMGGNEPRFHNKHQAMQAMCQGAVAAPMTDRIIIRDKLAVNTSKRGGGEGGRVGGKERERVKSVICDLELWIKRLELETDPEQGERLPSDHHHHLLDVERCGLSGQQRQ